LILVLFIESTRISQLKVGEAESTTEKRKLNLLDLLNRTLRWTFEFDPTNVNFQEL